MDRNVAKAMAIANQSAGTAANVPVVSSTISPTATKPQSLNGIGYDALTAKINAMRLALSKQKVYNPSVIMNSSTESAGAVLDFVLDLMDLDPMQAVPYFLRGLRTESKLDIPVVFDPSIFVNNSFVSNYIERQSFTLQNFAAPSQVAEIIYADPNDQPTTLGVFFRLKVNNRLQQASFSVSHDLIGPFAGNIYTQNFYMVDNVAGLFIPFLAPALIADVGFDAVNNTLIPTFAQGANFVIGARNPGGWTPSATGFSPDLTPTSGQISISNLNNIVVEATLVSNYGNPALSLTRAILENQEAAFFDTINIELI